MRRIFGRVVQAVGVMVVLAAGLALPVAAQADPGPTQVTHMAITSAQSDGTTATVTGQLSAAVTGLAVPGALVTLSISGASVTSGVTGPDGGFSLTFPSPAPGNYTVRARFDGETDWGPANTSANLSVPRLKVNTSLKITPDSDSVTAGADIGVSGVLVDAAGQPVDSAMVSLSCSWGCDPATAVTDTDGSFETAVTLSETASHNSVTLTVSFGGDDIFNPCTGKADIAVGEAPTEPTDSPTAEPPAPSSQSAGANGTPSASQTDSLGPLTVASLDPAFAAEGSLILSVLAGVAATSVVILIAVGIISNQRHRLAAGEQRGFGSDFGKHEH